MAQNNSPQSKGNNIYTINNWENASSGAPFTRPHIPKIIDMDEDAARNRKYRCLIFLNDVDSDAKITQIIRSPLMISLKAFGIATESTKRTASAEYITNVVRELFLVGLNVCR